MFFTALSSKVSIKKIKIQIKYILYFIWLFNLLQVVQSFYSSMQQTTGSGHWSQLGSVWDLPIWFSLQDQRQFSSAMVSPRFKAQATTIILQLWHFQTCSSKERNL